MIYQNEGFSGNKIRNNRFLSLWYNRDEWMCCLPFRLHISSHILFKKMHCVLAVCLMIQSETFSFNMNRDKEILEAERECIFEIFIWGRRLITVWGWYMSVAHRKRIIFQWKPKPYCWECTIWISKGFAPTSIFSGITQESARRGKTDWWWIMYILVANCDICLATYDKPKSSAWACGKLSFLAIFTLNTDLFCFNPIILKHIQVYSLYFAFSSH